MNPHEVPVMQASPHWSDAIHNRLSKIWQAGQFSNFGPQVRELEELFAQKMQVSPSQVVSVTNATLGLAGALQTSGMPRWLVPSWTFAATVHAAVLARVKVSLVDVREDTWMNSHIGKNPADSGVLLVLPFGAGLADFNWGDDQDVVIDAAASITAKFPSLSNLPKKSSVVFSLHATKVLGAGEGGVVVFGTEAAARRFRQWTNFGFDSRRESALVGLNAKMSEITAACNIVQLENWDRIIQEWAAARATMETMASSVGIEVFSPVNGGSGPYFIALFSGHDERNMVEKFLHDGGVETRRWWGAGCHKMPAFLHLPREALFETERVSGRYLGLPLFPGLAPQHVRMIEQLFRANLAK